MEDRDCGVRLMEDGRFPCHALVLISLEAEIKHHGGPYRCSEVVDILRVGL